MPKFNPVAFSSGLFKGLGHLWLDMTGSTSDFSLESRIFHSISAGVILIACVYVPYNLYAGLYVASLSTLIVALFFFWQYYNSRFLGKTHSSTAFGLFGLLMLGINYFYNAGINGSTDLIWPAYLLLIFAISPYHQHLRWLITYIIFFVLIHLLEYYLPALVKYPFQQGRGQFIDRVTAFPMPVLVIYLVARFIKRSYHLEREAAREKTVAVEKSNAEKTRLMSIISHDLRTPLLNVQSYLELLRSNDLESSERPELEEALLSSTNGAVEMLSNLLHWSKSQMEGAQVRLQHVNLLQVLSGTVRMQALYASKKGITLTCSVPEQLTVVADIDMLQLVVRNLISNAVKFTPAGGAISILAQTESGHCKIVVSDNGTGVPEDQRAHLFSVRSAPTSGTNNERGVGLGLVLCKEYTERQGGTIGFLPNPEGGSSFFITLPLDFLR
ncbi:HAMP domain-containing sensor histidine kinase [Pedobacter sp. JY14-1]|uniref:sensor histidine kinase n=1 Tax=Pedobacter sp. JY14-1 TaxID=3034151 RepID=UPI0023E20452|nr:HAMP domain-containing sensor histidine kinase [Pedobacter sp. JY14-1]